MKLITAICILALAALPAQAQRQVIVTEYGDVLAMGEWQALNKALDKEKHDIQIRCFRLERMCVEAVATFSNGQPTVHMNVYKITRWSSEEVVAENKALCVTVTLRINLLNEDITSTYVPAPEIPGPDACKFRQSWTAGINRLTLHGLR